MPQGLPQSGTLSPGLWIAYVYHLPEHLQKAEKNAKVKLFGDDIVVWISAKSTQQCQRKRQKAFNAIAEYCQDNDISMNPTKTVVLPFTVNQWKSRKPEYSLQVEGQTAAPSDCGKFSGVWLDSRLSFTKHLANAAAKYKKWNRIMRALSGRAWGAEWNTVEIVRKGFAEPIAFYAAGKLFRTD